MPVENHAHLSPEALRAVEAELEGHRTLLNVIEWGSAQPPDTVTPQVIADVVVQDEFTHDAIVPWRDGLVIVYGVT